MHSIVSMFQEFKLRRSQSRRRRSTSPPPKSAYIQHSQYEERVHSCPSFSRVPQKTVQWGSVTQIPPPPRGRHYPLRNRASSRCPGKSNLKQPTRLDQEMFRHNMWHMVGMADERLEFTYQCIGDMRGMGDKALDLIMKWEEQSVRNELTRKVIESAYELDNLSLESIPSHSRRPRMLRRRQ
ncbi:uncharacterized protein KD926_006752 [Aspergillus affinis]|uniref:uncharacterized protein n=1 Tax=Aspergillus affinis TaxID=1070780 RepID=UPI0022FDBA7E|nr:uncharacterized protein KD926_006752 [Aspergillus affinis]KAI9041514.1 hypothetical protein KD926_006752 [Aspergillus affinis]